MSYNNRKPSKRAAGLQDESNLPSLQPPPRRSNISSRRQDEDDAFDLHANEVQQYHMQQQQRAASAASRDERDSIQKKQTKKAYASRATQQQQQRSQEASTLKQGGKKSNSRDYRAASAAAALRSSGDPNQATSTQTSTEPYPVELEYAASSMGPPDVVSTSQTSGPNRTINAASIASSNTADAAIPVRPGAYAIPGPGFDDTQSVATIQIGGDTENNVPPLDPNHGAESPTSVMTALDATIVTDSERNLDTTMPPTVDEEQELPPLVEGIVDKSCTIRDRRTQFIVGIVCFVVIGAVVAGILIAGSTGGGGSGSTRAPTIPIEPTTSPMPTFSPTSTSPPTESLAPSTSPTALVTLDSGSISVTVGFPSVPLSYSRDGTRVAIVESTGSATVYEEQNGGSWTQLGNTIALQGAASVSLSGNRIAVGSSDASVVQILELSNNVWTPVGNNIPLEGWTVSLSLDGTVVAVEGTSEVRVYNFGDTDWVQRGNAIATSSSRTNVGNTFARMSMSDDGTSVAGDLSVYQYDVDQNVWVEQPIDDINSDPPDTPISMSGDGRVVAVGQPSSNINGFNSGLVRVFGLVNNNRWRQLGDDIIGDGQVGGTWGWSHALSQDGQRIVVMNNPSAGANQAILYRLEGSSWTRLFDSSLPVTGFSNGTIALSSDGNRVAIASQSTIQFYSVAGSTS